MKPLIGCTTYHKIAAEEPPVAVVGLMPSYIRAVEAAGGLPVLIPLDLSQEVLEGILARLDGLLLPGGGDVAPSLYLGQPDKSVRGVDQDRDRVEAAMVRAAVGQQKPMLAICRGIQLLNVAMGGTLWVDVGSQMPGALPHDNFQQRPRNYLSHIVEAKPDSLLARTMGRREIAVNSLHHQGIRRLAPALRPTATAPDGLIEAVEIPNHPYALGVQWHPENLIEDDPGMLCLFEGLVRAAAASH